MMKNMKKKNIFYFFKDSDVPGDRRSIANRVLAKDWSMRERGEIVWPRANPIKEISAQKRLILAGT